jgi:hypothetical protein
VGPCQSQGAEFCRCPSNTGCPPPNTASKALLQVWTFDFLLMPYGVADLLRAILFIPDAFRRLLRSSVRTARICSSSIPVSAHRSFEWPWRHKAPGHSIRACLTFFELTAAPAGLRSSQPKCGGAPGYTPLGRPCYTAFDLQRWPINGTR